MKSDESWILFIEIKTPPSEAFAEAFEPPTESNYCVGYWLLFVRDVLNRSLRL